MCCMFISRVEELCHRRKSGALNIMNKIIHRFLLIFTKMKVYMKIQKKILVLVSVCKIQRMNQNEIIETVFLVAILIP